MPAAWPREMADQLRFIPEPVGVRDHLTIWQPQPVQRIQPVQPHPVPDAQLPVERVRPATRRQPVQRVQAHVKPVRPPLKSGRVAAGQAVLFQQHHPAGSPASTTAAAKPGPDDKPRPPAPPWLLLGSVDQGGSPAGHTCSWTSWDKGEPKAPYAWTKGTLWTNNCKPYCAVGKITYHPLHVTFSMVKVHKGIRYFSRMTWYTPGYKLYHQRTPPSCST